MDFFFQMEPKFLRNLKRAKKFNNKKSAPKGDAKMKE